MHADSIVGHLLVVQQVLGRWADWLSPAQTTDEWNHFSCGSEDEAGGEDSTVMFGEEGEEAGIR